MMRNANIVKVDSKGRLLIPYHLRELHDIEEGAEFVIVSNHRGEIKLLPLLKGKTAHIKLTMADDPSSLAKITSIMVKNNISIIMSQTKALERGYLAEWNAIVDVSECSSVKKFYRDISQMENVKNVEIEDE